MKTKKQNFPWERGKSKFLMSGKGKKKLTDKEKA